MRKIFLLLVVCLVVVVIFVGRTFNNLFNDNDDVSIHVKDNDRRYELRAEYPRRKTHLVQHFMDQKLHANNVFKNSRIDAQITIDEISLRVRTRPGYLSLKMDKTQNDSTAYARLKDLEEELKQKLGAEVEN